MSNGNNGTRKSAQIGVGWLKNTRDGRQFISARSNGASQKVKLFAQMEDGSTVPVNTFAVFFNEQKPNEKAPDVQFVFTPEEAQ